MNSLQTSAALAIQTIATLRGENSSLRDRLAASTAEAAKLRKELDYLEKHTMWGSMKCTRCGRPCGGDYRLPMDESLPQAPYCEDCYFKSKEWKEANPDLEPETDSEEEPAGKRAKHAATATTSAPSGSVGTRG
jgi:hypothetical protein